jgi:hypothetical protein
MCQAAFVGYAINAIQSAPVIRLIGVLRLGGCSVDRAPIG